MLVTGFFDLGRYESRRTSRDEWVARTQWIRSQPHRWVCVETEGDVPLADLSSQWQRILVAPPDFGDLSRVTENLGRSQIGWDPMKDTARYFCLMHHRVQWMREAARVAPEGQVLTWIDMGVPHAADDSLDAVVRVKPAPGKIRICAISYVPRHARADLHRYYERHWWPVGGGLWSGRRAEIEWLAEQIAQEWRLSLDAGYVATDEMMIGRIVAQHPERFECYFGDHPTLIRNWAHVQASHRLIAEMALRALEDGDESAARGRFAALADGLRDSLD